MWQPSSHILSVLGFQGPGEAETCRRVLRPCCAQAQYRCKLDAEETIEAPLHKIGIVLTRQHSTHTIDSIEPTMLVTGNSSDVHRKGSCQGLLTFTLADRHSRRLDTVFASQPTNGELLGALREFELAYRQELGVCLTCSMSVILMATETQIFKIQGGASQHVHEALRHPVPRVLSVISIFYAVLGVLLHLSASQLLCYYTLTSVERAESWRQNALRVRWLPAKLSAPHVFSAW